MYYAKKTSALSRKPYDSLQISSDVQAYAIGIGYSYKDCSLEHNHIPTKFVKFTEEILKWLSDRGKDIIVVNHKECKHGKRIFDHVKESKFTILQFNFKHSSHLKLKCLETVLQLNTQKREVLKKLSIYCRQIFELCASYISAYDMYT